MNSYISIYLHFVWGTWNREASILPAFERALWAEVRHEILAQKCRLLAIGGTSDHVHTLVQFIPTISVSVFVQRVKGASSLWVNEQIRPESHFKWQGSYGVFSIGRREVPEIIGYIKKQKKHHHGNTLMPEFERTNRPAPD